MQEFLQNEMLVQALITLGLLVAVMIIVKLGQRVSKRALKDPGKVFRASRSMRRLGVFIALVGIVLIWTPGFRDVLTVFTVIGAGMAIALRDVLLSIAGWMRVVTLSEYKDGDRIEVNGIKGDVIDIRVMRTTLMEIDGWVEADQSTGRIVHIPNSWIFEHGVFNYTRAFRFIWNEFSVTVSFRSDWRAARDIIMKYAEESAEIVEKQARTEIHAMSREFLIHYSILTPFVYVKIAPNGVRLTLRYLCEARKRRGSEHALSIMIIDDFRQHPDIELAFDTVRIMTPEARQFEDFPAKSHPDGPGHATGVRE